MSQSNTPLQSLATDLSAEGLAAAYFQADTHFPLPCVQVALDEDPEAVSESRFALRMYLSPVAEPGVMALQMQMPLPIVSLAETPPLKQLEWFRLLAGCNECLPLGAFNLTAEGEIHFSYVLRVSRLTVEIVLSTLELIAEWVHTVMPLLEALHNSSHSAEDLLERLDVELEQMA
jgi:hypothetical protein